MATRNPSLNYLKTTPSSQAIDSIAGNALEAELYGPRGCWWWTGKEPQECPGFDPEAQALKSLPLPTLQGYSRQQVMDYFDNSWTLTEVLFASLQGTDAFIRQPYHQLRHPKIFYYGHPAVLYINKFRVAGLLQEGIDLAFETLFETGVDEMSWDDLSQGRNDWPSVHSVTEYRKKAYPLIRKVIEEHPDLEHGGKVSWEDPCWGIFMGFEHERIHIETSSVLIKELPLSSVRKPEYWPSYHPSAFQPSPAIPVEGTDYPDNNQLVPVAGEKVILGKPLDYPSFGWDNEYGSNEIDVQSFSASRFKVTNGEFLAFVKAGGYSNNKFWSSEGWGWKTFRNVKWPTFWILDGPQGLHRYKLRALFDAVEMQWDWPVDANYHEAKAYCAWKAEKDGSEVMYRIITEAEHMLIRNHRDRADAVESVVRAAPELGMELKFKGASDAAVNIDVCLQASGSDIAAKYGFNMQLAYSSQSPVTQFPPSDKGFYDTLGNAWEWGEDHFAAYQGFKVHPYYEDFSSPCFGGKHQVIIGGSFISTGQLASKFARYQFRPHFFQHATFRVVCQFVDRTLYDMTRYGKDMPLRPFYTTSCMDCAAPYVGDGPCCSVHRKSSFTPTVSEGHASSQAKQDATQIFFESDVLISRYLSMHYGTQDQTLSCLSGRSGAPLSMWPAFTEIPIKRSADSLIEWARRSLSTIQQSSGKGLRALDVGCAVGRGVFELALASSDQDTSIKTPLFSEVLGLDISARFIEVAVRMKEKHQMDYDLNVEGDISMRVSASLPPLGSQGWEEACSRTKFIQGDACSLSSLNVGSFDAVLAADILDCVPEPMTLLRSIHTAMKAGGVLLLSSPYAWNDRFTSRDNWIGGTRKDGEPERSSDTLQNVLVDMGFECVSEEDAVPLLMPIDARRFELRLLHTMVLRKY